MLERIETSEATLRNLTEINIIVGRNGSGKSRFLRRLSGPAVSPDFAIRYLSPERTGAFDADANISNVMRNNRSWVDDERRKNQPDRFKMASRERLVDLTSAFYQKMESNENGLREDLTKTFASV